MMPEERLMSLAEIQFLAETADATRSYKDAMSRVSARRDATVTALQDRYRPLIRPLREKVEDFQRRDEQYRLLKAIMRERELILEEKEQLNIVELTKKEWGEFMSVKAELGDIERQMKTEVKRAESRYVQDAMPIKTEYAKAIAPAQRKLSESRNSTGSLSPSELAARRQQRREQS